MKRLLPRRRTFRYEDAVRNAISLGGDADTMACIAGAIAEPYYGGVPEVIRNQALERLDERLRRIVEEFVSRFSPRDDVAHSSR
jgi:ADP-ribosylglycohydrolase